MSGAGPTLGPDRELLGRVRAALADDPAPLSPGRVAAVVRDSGLVLGDVGLLDVVDALHAELLGAGPLTAVLSDPQVTDVLVNGPAGVWVDRGEGLEPAPVELGDSEAVRRLAVRLAALAGRRLDDATPWVDARLPDGTRLHAVLPPVVQGGPHLSLRVPRRTALSFDDLVTAGTVPLPWAPVLRALVARRAAYVVTGGTGAGKTTVLAALLALVPEQERLVVVEDAAELVVSHPHVVRLEGRPPNVEGAGAVTMTDLVRQAMRMRPDRLVIGEVRGAEVRELLAALNTGHEGGCGTVHANAATDLPARLEALGALAGLDQAAVAAQAGSALDVVVHLRRSRGRGAHRAVDRGDPPPPFSLGRPGVARTIGELGVVTAHRDGLQVVPALVTARGGGLAVGPGWPALVARLDLDPDPEAVAGQWVSRARVGAAERRPRP